MSPKYHGGRGGQDRDKVLRCPFCKEPAREPEEISLQFDTFEGGACPCGSVYTYDRTGRMLGEAYSRALLYAFGGDYDKAFSTPEEQYSEVVIRYNQRVRQFIEGEGSIKDRLPTFYFLKVKKPS